MQQTVNSDIDCACVIEDCKIDLIDWEFNKKTWKTALAVSRKHSCESMVCATDFSVHVTSLSNAIRGRKF